MSNAVADRNDLYAAINSKRPMKSYIKTELGKVFVHVLDKYTDKPVGMLLEGDPRKKDKGCIIDFWSDKEDVFFREANKLHFERGTVIPYTRPEQEVKERTMEEYSDDELKDILTAPFFSLKSALDKTTSVGLVFRFLSLAQELEKSDAYIRAIESKLSELQSVDEFNPITDTEL
jgi:hypothetical protein